MAEVEFVGEVPSRKRKGGSHTDKNKKRRREPTIEILESPIAPVEVQSPAEDETAAAVQELLNELNQIQVEDYSRRASRGHEAARSEKLLRLLSDRAQTLHNDRTFYSKQSYRFCFFILTVFGGEMTSQC